MKRSTIASLSLQEVVLVFLTALVVFIGASFLSNFFEESKENTYIFENTGCSVNSILCDENTVEEVNTPVIAQKSGVLEENLRVLFKVESSGKGFENGHIKVRFECHIFNGKGTKHCKDLALPQKEVKCDGFDPIKGYSDEASETNYDAFEKALAIDKDRAICSTSFGIGQIMGFNYKSLGYSSYEEFYDEISKRENQEEIILKFLDANPALKEELKKENPDWNKVASYYNERPDYATLLAQAASEIESGEV
jgi:hypothetical protein